MYLDIHEADGCHLPIAVTGMRSQVLGKRQYNHVSRGMCNCCRMSVHSSCVLALSKALMINFAFRYCRSLSTLSRVETWIWTCPMYCYPYISFHQVICLFTFISFLILIEKLQFLPNISISTLSVWNCLKGVIHPPSTMLKRWTTNDTITEVPPASSNVKVNPSM